MGSSSEPRGARDLAGENRFICSPSSVVPRLRAAARLRLAALVASRPSDIGVDSERLGMVANTEADHAPLGQGRIGPSGGQGRARCILLHPMWTPCNGTRSKSLLFLGLFGFFQSIGPGFEPPRAHQ